MNLQITKGIEWKPHLSRLLILGAASLYLAIAAYIRFEMKDSLDRTRAQTQQQQTLNQASADSQAAFDEFYPLYQQYERKGRIGLANRLNWIETLNSLALEIGIPDMHFNLENTQISQEGSTAFFHYEIPIYVTNMYLDLKLLHEGDLYRLLNAYAATVQGSYSVEACEIRKLGGTAPGSTADEFLLEGLQAKCHLRWFNLHDLRDQWSENADAS